MALKEIPFLQVFLTAMQVPTGMVTLFSVFISVVFDCNLNSAQAVSERLFYYVYFANCTDEEIQSLLNKYYAKEPLPLLGIIKICFFHN